MLKVTEMTGMFRKLASICAVLCFCLPALTTAQEGYRMEVDLREYDNDTLLLAYYMGERQLIKDTAFRSNEGLFVFEWDEPIDPGMYMLVEMGEMNFFQLLVDEGENDLRISAEHGNITESIEVSGSPQNTAFFKYLAYLDEQRKKADRLREEKNELPEEEREALQEQLTEIDERVLGHQKELAEEYSDKFFGVFLKANMDPEMPEFEGTDEEVRREQFQYYRKNFFENIDLTDDRLLRSPVLATKVNQYLDQVVPRHPDSISKAVTLILDEMEENRAIFRYFLPNLLNKYARSNIIGMDAVYVHIIDTYYRQDRAPWTNEEQLNQILERADRMRPVLIGKTAPDITVQDREGSRVRLHDLDYEITVLYFWRPDCGHCRRYTPRIIEFLNDFEDKGVGVVTICTKFTDEGETCWDYVDKTEGAEDLFNLVDPFHRSRFSVKYDVRSTPMIYILDADKEILSKRLSADQLFDVVPMFLDDDEEAMEMLEDETPTGTGL